MGDSVTVEGPRLEERGGKGLILSWYNLVDFLNFFFLWPRRGMDGRRRSVLFSKCFTTSEKQNRP